MSIAFGPAQSIVGTDMQDAEPPHIAVSGRNVYVLWHEFPTAAAAVPDVFFARSSNRGQTFSPRMNLSNSANEDSRDEDMALSDGDIYIVWSEAGNIKFRKSTDNGASFDTATQLNGSTVNALGPQIKVDDSDVYVVWSAEPAAGTATEIFLAHSDDGGKNFDAETNVSNTTGNSQAPQAALSGDRIVVTWQDDSNPGKGLEIFYARST